jgi:hypothetical protein
MRHINFFGVTRSLRHHLLHLSLGLPLGFLGCCALCQIIDAYVTGRACFVIIATNSIGAGISVHILFDAIAMECVATMRDSYLFELRDIKEADAADITATCAVGDGDVVGAVLCGTLTAVDDQIAVDLLIGNRLIG